MTWGAHFWPKPTRMQRQLTYFSDFRHASLKDFLTTSKYVEYLRNYYSHFNLWPHIKLSTRVVSVSRGSRHNHVIKYQADRRSLQWGCDTVAICSGLHVEPNVPEISGISHARRVMHSSQSNHANSLIATGR
ncbi:dimethylaniline monooxygenase [Beauveria bassiana ARSEF 2860]|uniref:Dimethylaniline monooxygenase n=1 Tax=Beauveria bassiana (strain ARSEF 2860) TaxID=655819 RepID=J4KKS3_BEAB2|nr:dimethylaniline monooxygenase [Beauveria bassiana ARSEF 2860]EJP60954.1 dimethylaniline monooxygenase [Beauveria bassiana ARSEF 2860]